jgi:hypothetical protein
MTMWGVCGVCGSDGIETMCICIVMLLTIFLSDRLEPNLGQSRFVRVVM